MHLRLVLPLLALLTACAPAAPPSPTATRQASPAAAPTAALALTAPSKPAASPTAAAVQPPATPTPPARPTPPSATPTSQPASRPSAEVEFAWGQMDPMHLEHDDGTMARQAQSLPGVLQALVSDSGITIRYDPQRTSEAEIRGGLVRLGLPIKP